MGFLLEIFTFEKDLLHVQSGFLKRALTIVVAK